MLAMIAAPIFKYPVIKMLIIFWLQIIWDRVLAQSIAGPTTVNIGCKHEISLDNTLQCSFGLDDT